MRIIIGHRIIKKLFARLRNNIRATTKVYQRVWFRWTGIVSKVNRGCFVILPLFGHRRQIDISPCLYRLRQRLRSGQGGTQNAVAEVISEIFLDKWSLTSQLYFPLNEYGLPSDQSMLMEWSDAVLESNWYLPFPGWNTKLTELIRKSFDSWQGSKSKCWRPLPGRIIYLIPGLRWTW